MIKNETKKSEKYSRQILLKEIGNRGQKKLRKAQVAIIGIGALGTVAAELLIRAGAENLILVDRDIIELSNLQRQSLFTEKEIGKSKALAAQTKLNEINPAAKIVPKVIHLDSENISFLQPSNLILDCTDNFETRFLLNDFCRKEQIKWIYAAAIKTEGYVMPILPNGPCLRCFLREASLDTCDLVGVLNTITFSIAALQVTLALQILLGVKIKPQLYHYNIWTPELRKIIVHQNPHCPSCQGKYEYLSPATEKKLVHFCSSQRYQIRGKPHNFAKLKEKWQKLGSVVDDGTTLRFQNLMLFRDGRVLIKANSEREARAIYSQYIGD